MDDDQRDEATGQQPEHPRAAGSAGRQARHTANDGHARKPLPLPAGHRLRGNQRHHHVPHRP